MSENGIDSESINKPAADAGQSKGASKSGKKAKPAKKAGRATKAAVKTKADRVNKKAEVIAMMKRAKGATLDEIMKATGGQPHSVRGFVSILGSKGGRRSSRPRTQRASGRTRSENSVRQLVVQNAARPRARAAFLLSGASK
jgi:hypothetical protein